MIHKEYLIAYDERGIYMEDYYSCMAAISHRWKQYSPNDIYKFALHDFVSHFDLLNSLMCKEKETEWRALPLDSNELKWHLVHQEFYEMLTLVRKEMDELFRLTRYYELDADEYKLEEHTDYNVYSKYKMEPPHATLEWRSRYHKEWRKEGIIYSGDNRPLWADPMDKSTLINKIQDTANALYSYAIHAHCMIEASCKMVHEKIRPVLLLSEQWQTLIHNVFIQYVKDNGNVIEKALQNSVESHISAIEEPTPEKWMLVYEEELKELQVALDDAVKYKLNPKINTWVLKDFTSPKEIYLPDAANIVKQLMDRFSDEIKNGDHDGSYHQTFMKDLNELFRAIHRMNLIKCHMRPDLMTEYVKYQKNNPGETSSQTVLEESVQNNEQATSGYEISAEGRVKNESDTGNKTKLCIVLNKAQCDKLEAAEKEGVIMYNSTRKGYDIGYQSSKALVAYLCGRLFCGDSTAHP